MTESAHDFIPTSSSAGTAAGDAVARRLDELDVDGVICLGGEDWWYHNRGHFDMRMMTECAAARPVLYVNSVGMRVPRPAEGRMFVTRVRRKLASLRRGLVRVDERFHVMSPPCLPGAIGAALTRGVLTRAVADAAASLGLSRPLVWIACPPAAEVVDALDPAAVVYQRTDRYECFPHVDGVRIARLDAWLKARADVTVFCAVELFAREAETCGHAVCVDHGVDAARFAAAARAPAPEAVRDLPRPLVGFVGGIDGHTFDPALFNEVVDTVPDAHFLLVGGCSLPEGWCPATNVTMLGRKPYDDVPALMAACDALIMPWRRSRWIEGCNPVKLKEYLATGRPVVSTPFPELRHHRGLVRVADTAPAFAAAVRAALADPGDPRPRQARARGHAWSSKLEAVLRAVADETIGRDEDDPTPGVPAPRARPAGTMETKPLVTSGAPAPPAADDVEAFIADRSLTPAALVLLAGGLRPSPLVADVRTNVLDLWLDADGSLLDVWRRRLAEVETAFDTPIPLRIALGPADPAPLETPAASHPHRGELELTRTAHALRGAAGLLRDVSGDLPADATILVAEAARYPGASLLPLIHGHAARAADVTVAVNRDGTPAGLYVLRAETLRLVGADGYQDLKEQWLPRVARAGGRVFVHPIPGAGVPPLRTTSELLTAAACLAGEDRSPRAVCPGASVAPDAIVEEAIVMPRAVVGAGALVTRAVVGPGADVPRRSEIVDAVVPGRPPERQEACG